jgi:hypothetical protein
VGALADREVGKYLTDHFVASYHKVGTFRITNRQKQGGNVASYFCTADLRVLHVVPGPVSAAVLLREARWVVETFKLARLELLTDDHKKTFFSKAHSERLKQEHGGTTPTLASSDAIYSIESLNTLLGLPENRNRSRQEKVHVLLSATPLPELKKIYRVVFEAILDETVATNPVAITD